MQSTIDLWKKSTEQIKMRRTFNKGLRRTNSISSMQLKSNQASSLVPIERPMMIFRRSNVKFKIKYADYSHRMADTVIINIIISVDRQQMSAHRAQN